MSERVVVLTDARRRRTGPRYTIVQRLGAGAMGIVPVYSLEREVATGALTHLYKLLQTQDATAALP